MLRPINFFCAISRKMSSCAKQELRPAGVRGLKTLEKDKFLHNVVLPVLKVNETNLAKIIPVCKSYLLKLEQFKPVQNCAENSEFKKTIFLNPVQIGTWDDFTEETRKILNNNDVTEKNFSCQEAQLCYDNWKYNQIFKAVLPEDEEQVSGFSQIGHIIHLNLRDHLLEYRFLIGQVLLDKIKTCKTVVNKNNIIDNTYRNFSMEVLAGQEDFLVTVKENRCNFRFDFSKVYWNPRLGKEHERILSYLKPDDVLFDVFCGVGPFSVPAAKRKIKVFANDLNAESYKWLNYNAKANKVNDQFFKSYNLDGKDFILIVFRKFLIDLCEGKEKLSNNSSIHVTMNLPALAIEFLQYFKSLLDDKELINKLHCKIIVYVYSFVTGENEQFIVNAAREQVVKSIGYDVANDITEVFDVRNVSPNKEMMRITFNLTKDVIFCTNSIECEPPTKKICTIDVGL